MGDKSILDFPFPVLGLDRRQSVRRKPPFSAEVAENVRPNDPSENRVKGGTRPGDQKAFLERLGTGTLVQSLAQMNITGSNPVRTWTDEFEGSSLISAWSLPAFTLDGESFTLPTLAIFFSDNKVMLQRTLGSLVDGVVRDDLTDLDLASSYKIAVTMFETFYLNESIHVFLKMDASTPDVQQDGLDVELELDSITPGITNATADVSGKVRSYVGGTLQNTYNFATGSTIDSGYSELQIIVDGTNLKVTLRDIVLLDTNLSESQAGGRVGLAIKEPVSQSQRIHIDTFSIRYVDKNFVGTSQRRQFAGVGEGGLYLEDDIGMMMKHTSTITMRPDVTLQAIEHLSKLYIADYGDQRAERFDGTIDSAGTTLDTSGAFTFNDKGIDKDAHVVEIFEGDGGVVDGVYEIASIQAGDLTLATSAGTTGNCSFRIERGPKVYDPSTNVLDHFAAAQGITPFGHQFVTRYQDRLCWAGHLRDSRNWLQSRAGTPDDYDLAPSTNSIGRAVAGQSSEAGFMSAPVTCQAPHSDDYLVYATLNSLWVLRGDATVGGRIDNLSHAVGIIDGDAFTYGPEGELVFMSRDGLYVLPFGLSRAPVALSAEKIPQELKNLNPSEVKVSIEYDINDRGVHIFVSPLTTGAPKHFWYDWGLKGFWPISFASNFDPFVVARFASESFEQNAVIMGCRDGFLRKFVNGSNLDDASSISSKIALGPFFLGDGADFEGILTELRAALDAGSADIKWSVYVGDTPELVLDAVNAANTPFATGTFTAGLNTAERPKARGNSVMLVLENVSGGGAWSFGAVTGKAKPAGRQRVLA